MNQEPLQDDEPSRTWQPRFGIGSLLLVMLVLSVMAASGSYFARALAGQVGLRPTFIIFTLIAPVALLMVATIARWLWLLTRRR